MSRETENLLKKFTEYIGDKDLSEAELQQALNEFFDLENKDREESLDYLEMAYQAENEDLALEFAMKALETDKDCLDAEILLIQLSSDGPEDVKIEYEALIKKTEDCFKEEGLLDKENIGSFWGILETRPYMRLRYAYLMLLITMGKFTKAISECEDLLSLSENDNLGIRYILIGLYALYEDEKRAMKLYKKHQEGTMGILLPMVAMYYKIDNYVKAEKYLVQLSEAYSSLRDFFLNLDEYDEATMNEIAEAGVYAHDSKEEIIITLSQNPYLYSTTGTFFMWIIEKLLEMEK
jgi:hypothetical protein